ncbi:MAG TPA: stress responsive protein [Bacteroidales bacterium]|nr:stress responsive protein [Bacteroidales bacterium]
MIRHIIMFKFKDVQNDSERIEKAERIKASFGQLQKSIPVVKSYEIAVNSRKTEFSYDVAIISEYTNWDDLKIYLNHPEHQKAIGLCKDIQKEKAVIDYEF